MVEIFPSTHCAACNRPFQPDLKIAAHSAFIPTRLPSNAPEGIPSIIRYPICQSCLKQIQRGSKHAQGVTDAVERRFFARLGINEFVQH